MSGAGGVLLNMQLAKIVTDCYYACMGLVPVVAGYLVDRSGGAAALWLAAILWILALPALLAFRVL